MLPPGDPGRNVLVVDDDSTSLTPLPLPTPADHALQLRVTLDCAPLSPAVSAEIELATRGFPDYELRAAAQEIGQSRRPVLGLRYRPTSGSYGFSAQTFSPVSDLGTNFHWSARGQCWGILSRVADGWQLRAPFWLPQEWESALHQRRTPLFLQQGYPLTLEEEISFQLPPGTPKVALPEKTANEQEPLRWRVQWEQSSATNVICKLHVSLLAGELNGEKTVLYQKQLGGLLTALGAAMTFSPR